MSALDVVYCDGQTFVNTSIEFIHVTEFLKYLSSVRITAVTENDDLSTAVFHLLWLRNRPLYSPAV